MLKDFKVDKIYNGKKITIEKEHMIFKFNNTIQFTDVGLFNQVYRNNEYIRSISKIKDFDFVDYDVIVPILISRNEKCLLKWILKEDSELSLEDCERIENELFKENAELIHNNSPMINSLNLIYTMLTKSSDSKVTVILDKDYMKYQINTLVQALGRLAYRIDTVILDENETIGDYICNLDKFTGYVTNDIEEVFLTYEQLKANNINISSKGGFMICEIGYNYIESPLGTSGDIMKGLKHNMASKSIKDEFYLATFNMIDFNKNNFGLG